MVGRRYLPTWNAGQWTVADLRDSVISTLNADRRCMTLTMFQYAVTQAGWDQLRDAVLKWRDSVSGRVVRLIVGTDHGITDPGALQRIQHDGVDVRVMVAYQGVFHPKVWWLHGHKKHVVWVGSNNLTRDGLLNNVEFALLIRSAHTPTNLRQWARALQSASKSLTSEILDSYREQRRKFESPRKRIGLGPFTWTEKTEATSGMATPGANPGDLVVEVMPRETGKDGRQLQLPVRAAGEFFGVRGKGSSKRIRLAAKKTPGPPKQLTVSCFGNDTVRITLSDLEYRDRPCVIVFRRKTPRRFEYEIVPENIFPSRYKRLLALAANQTRRGSRRWGIA